jgi:hypothetical protein
MSDHELSTLIGSSEETVWSRGHGPKILEATRSAHAHGRLPANPRPVEYREIIDVELDQLGYRRHKPSRTAIDVRYDVIYRPA